MPGFKGIDQLRSVEWSRKYLWDVILRDAPRPYNDWFPAQEIEFPEQIVKSYLFSAANTQIKIPEGTDDRTLRLTFVDDVNNTLLEYHKAWMKKIRGGNGFSMLPIKSAVRQLLVQKLDLNRNPIASQNLSFWVYPEGPINFTGNSDSAPHVYTVNYVIAGQTGAYNA